MTLARDDPDTARTARLGFTALVASAVAFLAVWIWAWVVLPPDGVVHHVGLGGPDAFGSRAGVLIPLLILAPALVLGLRWLAGALVRHGDGTGLNYPHKKYWLAPERRETFRRRFVGETDLFWSGTLLLMIISVVDIVALTRSPEVGTLMLPATGVYLGFTGWWVWWIVSRSRPPEAA